MTDVLYGCDLGAVATDAFGNLFVGVNLPVYSDPHGNSRFTLTKAVGTDFAVGDATAGTVVADALGRVYFYAQDNDTTLWLKNGQQFWAVNPVYMSDVVQKRVDATLVSRVGDIASLDTRMDAAEASITALQSPTAIRTSHQVWRARPAASKALTTDTYTSVGFGQVVNSANLFSVTPTNDAVSVSVAGWYRVAARVGITTSATGARGLAIVVNPISTTYALSSALAPTLAEDWRAAVAGFPTVLQAVDHVYLNTTDTVMVVAYQNSGGTIGTSTTAGQSLLSLAFLGVA